MRRIASKHRRWDEIGPELESFSDEQLAKFDIAVVNIALARGLPGAENLDPDACIDKLDSWAERVQHFTRQWWPRYLKDPAEYSHSPGQFKMMALVTVLQKHLGVRYNLSFMEGDYDGTDSRNLLLHGLLTGHGGTCGTMPVLYTAIGRRLGYPLKLVQAKEHMFARWEEVNGERFNIECTSYGFSTYDDAYYHAFPHRMTERELQSGYFLRSLTPRQELSCFLDSRAFCLMDNLRLPQAIRTFECALKAWPGNPHIIHLIATCAMMQRAIQFCVRLAGPHGFPNLSPENVDKVHCREPWERLGLESAKIEFARLDRVCRKRETAKAKVLNG